MSSNSTNNNSTQELEGYLDVEERDSREIQRDNLKRITREILAQRGPFYAGCAALVVSTAAIVVEPRLFGYVIDAAIVPHRWRLLQQLTLAYLILVVFRVTAQIGSAYLFELLGQRVTQELRCRLFSHLQRLPVTVFDKNPAGRLLTRVTNDISSLGEMFTAGFVSMIGNALMVIGIQIWLIVLDVKLGLIAGSILPFLAVASIFFSRKLRVAYREARSKLSALNAFLAENILGIKVVHLFNREARHLERFDRINQWYTDARIGSVRVFAVFQPTITICSAIAVALVIYFGGKETLAGKIQVGVLFAYFSYILSLFQPMREIADKWNIFLSGMASAERIFAILGWKTELQDSEVRGPAHPARAASGAAFRGHVVFENVWFAYEGEHWVLKDFSLEIHPGSRVGIVGHTGAGKTTLISLLMRFYEPQKGRILLDGKDLREYSKRELRAAIGIIQQDVFLFSGSLEENMTFWGAQPANSDELRVLLDRFGSRGGQEYQGELLERGGNLSVGERQVLAFTRALTARPAIWILDEATANMDSGSEAILQAELEKASQGMTSILIAHRLATVRSADAIVVIHKGSLVEKGTHEELITRDGLYARLYRYQQSLEKRQYAEEAQEAKAHKSRQEQSEPVS